LVQPIDNVAAPPSNRNLRTFVEAEWMKLEKSAILQFMMCEAFAKSTERYERVELCDKKSKCQESQHSIYLPILPLQDYFDIQRVRDRFDASFEQQMKASNCRG
jgi:hypothetical protein